MKIFAAGLATETNTFATIPTGERDFIVQRGRDVLAGRIDFPHLDLSALWGKMAQERGHEFIFGLNAWAQPSGTTTRRAYEVLRDEMLDDLRAAGAVDVVLLMLHGAMVSQGYDSCEEDIARRVRQIVGADVIIAVELDLHCHLTDALLGFTDIIVTFKEYPHVDMNDRAREVFDLAEAAQAGRIRPTMALFDCRMVGMYPTSRQPLRSFVDSLSEAEQRPGVLSLSFGHGFQFADLPHVGAKMLAITNNDPELAHALAAEFGTRVYALRREIGFESFSLSIDRAFAKAVASTQRPVVIADQSDNTGGGAPGDATFALEWVLEHDLDDVAVAILHDPQAVRIAFAAGIGSVVAMRLGGKLGKTSGNPLDLEVTVTALRQNYLHEFPQQSGDSAWYPVGDTAVLRHGTLDIVVGSERCQCFAPSIFSDLGIDPRKKAVLIVKSYQHFYSAFARLGGEVIYMSAQGAVPADPRQIPYRRLRTERLYPWVDDPIDLP